MTVSKLFALGRNTLYPITVRKNSFETTKKKRKKKERKM